MSYNTVFIDRLLRTVMLTYCIRYTHVKIHVLLVSVPLQSVKRAGTKPFWIRTLYRPAMIVIWKKCSFQVFHFASYASSVFATIRRAVGISEEDFLDSVAPKEAPFLEFISNSKSGQDFYLT